MKTSGFPGSSPHWKITVLRQRPGDEKIFLQKPGERRIPRVADLVENKVTHILRNKGRTFRRIQIAPLS